MNEEERLKAKIKYYISGILIEVIKDNSLRVKVVDHIYFLIYDETFLNDIELIVKGVLLEYLDFTIKSSVISRISKDIKDYLSYSSEVGRFINWN